MIIRKLPLIDGFDIEEARQIKKSGHRIVKSDVVDAIDQRLVAILAKILRRSKLILMRLDNFVGRHLESIKQRDGRKKNGVNVLEVAHEQQQEERQSDSDQNSVL